MDRLAGHALFVLFLLVAIGLRVAVSKAYWPGLELEWDSFDYLRLAHTLQPGLWHPSGYSLFLALVSVTGRLGVVVVIQHGLGLAMGVLVYVLALRWGARRWLAALAALPVLVDGYQLDIEQFILAETLTDCLLLAGMAVLLWREPVGARRGAVAGLLLVASTICRTAILPVLAVAGLYLLVRRRWRGLVAFTAVAAGVLVAYGAWFGATWGHFGYSDYSGYLMYGRVAPFATCRYPLPAPEARLCPTQSVARRSKNLEFWTWAKASPLYAKGLGTHHQRNALAKRFSETVIEHQPLAFARAVAADMWHYFAPGRWMTSEHIDMVRWVFPPVHMNVSRANYHVTIGIDTFHTKVTRFTRHPYSPDPGLIPALRTYQRWVYMPGPAFLVCLVAGLAAALGLARRPRRGGRSPAAGPEKEPGADRQPRWAALVLCLSALAVLLSPSLGTGFSYRYGLPLLVLLPPAGAIGIERGLRRAIGRRARPGRPASSWVSRARPATAGARGQRLR